MTIYHVIDRPHRPVMASTGWTPEGESMDTTVEVTFEDLAGRTLGSPPPRRSARGRAGRISA